MQRTKKKTNKNAKNKNFALSQQQISCVVRRTNQRRSIASVYENQKIIIIKKQSSNKYSSYSLSTHLTQIIRYLLFNLMIPLSRYLSRFRERRETESEGMRTYTSLIYKCDFMSPSSQTNHRQQRQRY